MNNVVKDSGERSYVELIDLMQMTENISQTHLAEQIDESWSSQMRMPIATGLDEWHQTLRKSITAWAANQLSTQLKLAIDTNYLMVADPFRPYRIHVRNTKRYNIDVDTSAMACTCGFAASRGLLCRHLLACCRNRFTMQTLAELAIQRANRRWFHETIASAFGITQSSNSTSAPARHERVVKQTALYLPHTHNMLQLMVKEQLDRIGAFARKNVTNARYALLCLQRWTPELLDADEITMKAAIGASQEEPTVNESEQSSWCASSSSPSNVVDPPKLGRRTRPKRPRGSKRRKNVESLPTECE